MAYLDLNGLHTSPQARTRRSATPVFDRLDEAAIEVAQHDGLASLRRPGRIGRFFEQLLGLHVASALADPRLEALRRLAVAARLGSDRIVAREAKAARDAGFTSFQVDALFARFGFAPAFERS